MEKNYTTYNAIDFAEEASFIRGVKGEDQKAIAFWKEWEATHPEKAVEIKEAKILVKAIQIKEEEPAKERIQNLWNKIDAATQDEVKVVQKQKETAVIRPLNRRRWMSLAAAACAGLLVFFYFYNPNTTISTSFGKHLVHVLPEGSKVQLNADSKIAFKEGSFNNNRIINLEGEAFFEVEKGVPFKVVTPNGTVEVLGTSFNVNARNGALTVDCKTGKVRVVAKGSTQTLTPGQGTKLNAQNTALEDTYPSNIDKKTGWINGEFYFTNATLSEVITELERQYDIDIVYKEGDRLGDYFFTGGDLEKALQSVTFQLVATYKIEGKKVTITKK